MQKKHILGLEAIKEEIEGLDISGTESLYQIAKELLLENNERITQKLEACYPTTYNSHMICTWPIFVEYRKTDEYKAFQDRHREDFEPYDFSVDSKQE